MSCSSSRSQPTCNDGFRRNSAPKNATCSGRTCSANDCEMSAGQNPSRLVLPAYCRTNRAIDPLFSPVARQEYSTASLSAQILLRWSYWVNHGRKRQGGHRKPKRLEFGRIIVELQAIRAHLGVSVSLLASELVNWTK